MNQIDLAGRVAIVTGGAKGIGLAIVERLLASGAQVSIWDRDLEAMKQTVAALSHAVHSAQVDIASADSVAQGFAATLAHFAKVDILVNNAGIAGASKKLWELSPEEWRQVVDIDLVGVFLVCRSVVPHMLSRNYGRIINIASIAGKEGNPNASHYSAAKAGVIALSKSLGKELAQSGILVNCITPAVIETDILQQLTPQHIEYMRSKIPMNRFGKKEEAAAMVAWLASEDCSFSTGATFDLSGGRATY
ncbi:MAG: SDR family oxidoreductase [Gemmataceae bacterium]|nr:SDR family oxidoreductase [Gemmataceae bacterium]